MGQLQPHVHRASVMAMRLVDIADTIDLAAVESLWARHARTAAARSRLVTTPPKAMTFGVPPVELALDSRHLVIGGVSMPASIMVRLYEFGVAAFSISVAANDLPWSDFSTRVNAVDSALGIASASTVWVELIAQITQVLGPALVRPSAEPLHEDYLLALVHAIEGVTHTATLHEQVDLVPLLSGESRPLSEQSRQELLRQRYAYYTDDLVVLTWDRAFIYEPRDDSDVVDIIEVANAQLLEMRYYDELLDAELPRMYDLIEATRSVANPFAARRYADLARHLHTLVAEVTEVTEKVDNALQVTEDVYLARVYAAALELFRVPHVSKAVDRKLAIIRDSYSALYEEASSKRGELMEMAIIVLIAVEIVIAMVRHV
ncbi:MAG TPA: hypothetical protein VFG49_02155 [Dyella sp.]|uniref:hypothetical protein n=1 Tax=Dyella sp. TaxID=1869338 RepID=UPI002D769B32|nr:hypothetical protein [Dyella sp.]HET6552315.1 hypothetical protein [Dyella sp.]